MVVSPASAPRLRCLPLLVLLIASACSEPPAGPPQPPPTEEPEPTGPAVVALSIAPDATQLFSGESITLEVTAELDDGSTKLLTEGVTWSSDAAHVASINAQGEVTAHAAGDAVLQASAGGEQASASIHVFDAASLVSLSSTPESLEVDTAVIVEALPVVTATLQDGSTLDVSARVKWASSDEGRLHLLPRGGMLGLAPGSAGLTGSLLDMQVEVPVELTGAAFGSLRFSKARFPLRPVAGATTGFQVLGLYSDGIRVDLTAHCDLELDDASISVPAPGTLELASAPAARVTVAQLTATLGQWGSTARVSVAPKRLFVANRTGASLQAYALPFGEGGDVSPLQDLWGPSTRLNSPAGIYFDPNHDELWLADSSSLFVGTFPAAPDVEGDVEPLRRLSNRGNTSRDVAYDADRDLLYVIEVGEDRINVFADPRQLQSGDPAPSRSIRIRGGTHALAFDAKNDRLFALMTFSSTRVAVINDASSEDSRAPAHEFAVSSSKRAQDMTFDAERQRLFVLTEDGRVLVVPNAAQAEGPTQQSATFVLENLDGAVPRSLAYDAESDTLYVGAGTGLSSLLLAYEGIGLPEGEVSLSETSRIEGPSTVLHEPSGLTVGW